MMSNVAVKKSDFCAILYNIRSAYNVGAMFRTADGVGISKLYLCGYTPTPTDRNVGKEIAKTALGAEEHVAWEKHTQTWRLLEKLKRELVFIVALEQTSRSIPYTEFVPQFPLCLLVGNEVRGISKSILKRADAIVEIPMYGKKESLNVSVAFGIVAYAIKQS